MKDKSPPLPVSCLFGACSGSHHIIVIKNIKQLIISLVAASLQLCVSYNKRSPNNIIVHTQSTMMLQSQRWSLRPTLNLDSDKFRC